MLIKRIEQFIAKRGAKFSELKLKAKYVFSVKTGLPVDILTTRIFIQTESNDNIDFCQQNCKQKIVA